MPGFLSAYEGTERVDLGDGYWADVKKCLSKKEAAAAQSAMGSRQRVDVGSGRQFATIDTGAYRTEMVAASLVAWNIDEADGTVWPLEPDKALRASLDRLPGPVFDRIWKVVDDLNGQESPAGRPDFLAQLASAIRMGTTGPEVLQDFLMEEQFWKRLGLTRETLEHRPWREVEHYSTIITLICREEQAQQRRAGGRSGR